MKAITTLLFVMITSHGLCQSVGVDTSYFPDGSYEIINLETRKVIYPDGLPDFGIIYDEKEVITSFGLLQSQRKHLGDGWFVYRKWDDENSLEYLHFHDIHTNFFTELVWSKNKNGKVLTESKISSPSGNIEHRFRESDGEIQALSVSFQKSPYCNLLSFIDSAGDSTFWIQTTTEFSSWAKLEVHFGDYQRELMWGKTLTLLFDVYPSESDYYTGSKPTGKSKKKVFKVGKWVQIDNDGKTILTEHDECPVLRNVVEK